MQTHTLPTYLRVVATTRCNMRCAYCHMEGDPHLPGTASELPGEELAALLRVAVRAGVRKLKFLGGEPLVRRDLPALVASLRDSAPDLDISAITAGALPARTLHELLSAGMSRLNLSIHGYGLPAFLARGGRAPLWHLRNEFLHALLAAGRPLKLNYVLSTQAGGAADVDDARADLSALLEDAAAWPATIAVLDDLGDPEAGPQQAIAAVEALRGPADARRIEPDPHSLPTLHLRWRDGLTVEIKDQRLGEVAPYAACGRCPAAKRCREGIYALRLTHDGRLQPCLDRPDLGLDLAGVLRQGGEAAALRAWQAYAL